MEAVEAPSSSTLALPRGPSAPSASSGNRAFSGSRLLFLSARENVKLVVLCENQIEPLGAWSRGLAPAAEHEASPRYTQAPEPPS